MPPKPASVTAIYPGSFDPITNGHLDLVQRGSRMFDTLVVAILRNDSKLPLFSVEERMDMLREVVGPYANVQVDCFDGLLVDYAAARSATVLLRGIRAISDYEYELQMALMNRRLRPDIETVFMMANEAYSFISSRLVKEVLPAGREYYRPGAAFGRSQDARPDAARINKERFTRPMQAVTNPIAERISLISVSSTMKVSADAEKLRAQGEDVVDFGAGEPDFPTPDNIKQAAIRALDQNFTKYTAAGGTVELKKAICERHTQDFGTSYYARGVHRHGGRQARHLQPDAGAGKSRR